MAVVPFAAGLAATFTPGEYEATAQGFAGAVTVKVTVDEEKVTAVTVTGENETPALGGAAIEGYNASLIGVADADAVDATAGATVTSNAVKEALAKALAEAKGEAVVNDAAVAFTAGTYTGTAKGYNGPVEVAVTFSDSAVTAIEVGANKETDHVGNVAFEPVIADILAANGTGVDGVSGATFSSNAIRNAVNDAAEQAGCTNMDAFKAAGAAHEPQAAIEETYDVVVVGAGGAGIAAAAQAAQDGNTVLVIEKNAEVGGNTLVSGGQYQSVMPYLVWDPADPDATTGVGYDGNTYNKVVESVATLGELKTILGWSEEPFDAAYYKDHEFVAGDIAELSKRGVHAEYLPDPQGSEGGNSGVPRLGGAEGCRGRGSAHAVLHRQPAHLPDLLRRSASLRGHDSWIYGDYDLVKQFIEGGQTLKQWLEAQGSTFVEDTQPTLIGALWYRENEFVGATIDGVDYPGRWGTYFKAPMNTVLAASETAASNKIMLRTTAEELIVEDGRVTGVKATQYARTLPVTAHATKGVVIATGGYAANLQMVVDTNVYWSSDYLSTSTKTTNRSSLKGDGITMAQAVGADVTGMGYTQMMPISWIDDGNLAFGGGNYAIYINPTTGKRFVDETSERDVLSLAEFRNGIEHNGTKGVFIELANASSKIPGPYLYGNEDVEWRQYVRTVDQLAELFASLGLETDADTVRATIENYDKAVMAGEQPEGVKKTNPNALIGYAEKDESGNYLPETYKLDGVELRVRFMAPSTHHTMGGIKVDTERHALDAEDNVIPGLYAAGEVTGGIHGGNRLGGNAIVEIFVSGRTAAEAIQADNQ